MNNIQYFKKCLKIKIGASSMRGGFMSDCVYDTEKYRNEWISEYKEEVESQIFVFNTFLYNYFT